MAGSAFAAGNIVGAVYDKGTAKPLDYASVVLVNPTTGAPLSIGTMTDESGKFVISNAPSGKYIIRVSMVGSISQEREIVVADSEINLGKIELAEDAKLLQELVVTGQKSQMSVNSERRVFNVSSNIAASGASADELLAAVPSVHVTSDGEISLRGNSDVLVWVNGKEMGMNADNRAQILRQLPAESIESIEVMTNPSSKHSTSGTAGIINIRLKEDHRHGYFGNAEANVDSRGTANVNFNINYNEGKFESFAGIGLKTQHAPAGSTSRRSYDNGTFLNSDGDSKKHENSMFLRLGTNFHPDEQNTIYLSAIGTLGHKWGRTTTTHLSNLPNQWTQNINNMRETGDTRGHADLAPALLRDSDVSFVALCGLLFCVGLGIGMNPDTKRDLRSINPRYALLPLVTILGSWLGAVVAWLILHRGFAETMAINSGFAYYSLSSIFITEFRGVELGTIALLANIIREMIALLLAPLLAKVFGPLAPITAGGATSMDTTLPIITHTIGDRYTALSIYHGFVVDFTVPFLVTMWCLL